jgi:ATP-dependent Lon protease
VEEDVLPEQLEGVNVHYANTINEVLDIALPTSKDEEKKDSEIREQLLSSV